MERELEQLNISSPSIPINFGVPYRWICRLTVKRDSKPFSFGTGVLVSPRHVLTTAHVIEVPERAQRKERPGLVTVDVEPGYNDGNSLGSYTSSDFRISNDWRLGRGGNKFDPAAFDFGMAILPNSHISSTPLVELDGKPLGYWGHPSLGYNTAFAPVKPNFVRYRTAWSSGYPRGMKHALWKGWGTLTDADHLYRGKRLYMFKRGMVNSALTKLVETLTSSANNELEGLSRARGASGGPVWINSENKEYLVGINANFTDLLAGSKRKWNGNATRISAELFNEVSKWIRGTP